MEAGVDLEVEDDAVQVAPRDLLDQLLDEPRAHGDHHLAVIGQDLPQERIGLDELLQPRMQRGSRLGVAGRIHP